jgi:hypothetical protein
MLKQLSAALVAASMIITPALAVEATKSATGSQISTNKSDGLPTSVKKEKARASKLTSHKRTNHVKKTKSAKNAKHVKATPAAKSTTKMHGKRNAVHASSKPKASAGAN